MVNSAPKIIFQNERVLHATILAYPVPVSILVAPGFRYKFLLVFHYNKAVEKTLFRCLSAVMDYALRIA